MVIPSGGQGGKGGKTGRRAMGVWARGLLQAKWRPRDGWGSATPSNTAASFPHSIQQERISCCALSVKTHSEKQQLVKHHIRLIASHSGRAWKGTWRVRLTGPLRRTSLQQRPAAKQGLAAITTNTVITKQSIKDCSLFSFFKKKNT